MVRKNLSIQRLRIFEKKGKRMVKKVRKMLGWEGKRKDIVKWRKKKKKKDMCFKCGQEGHETRYYANREIML